MNQSRYAEILHYANRNTHHQKIPLNFQDGANQRSDDQDPGGNLSGNKEHPEDTVLGLGTRAGHHKLIRRKVNIKIFYTDLPVGWSSKEREGAVI